MKSEQNYKITSVVTFGLAVLFYWFFMHAKHDVTLSKVNAFADDPYDAVGSFGIQAAAFLGVLGLIRAFRAPSADAELTERGRSVVLAQTAALLSVGVTLAADVVAMLRHPSLWVGSSAGYRLAALIAGMAALTIGIGFWIHHDSHLNMKPGAGAWTRAGFLSILIAFALLAYPQSFRRGLIGVLFTALIGTVFLFVSMRVWMMAFFPGSDSPREQVMASRSPGRKAFGCAVVILAGILIGLFFVAGESSEGSGIPHSRLAIVVSAYIGLETAGLIVGYGLLAKPLGLFRRESR